MPSTLADAKASRIPNVLNLAPTSPAFLAFLNQAQERLLHAGKYWGTYGEYRVCVTEGCITWPRQFAAIEAVALCGQPIVARNQWFQYLNSGAGLREPSTCTSSDSTPWHPCSCGQGLFDRGTACTFADIRGINKKIRVYADVAEAAGAKILLQGYDQNSQWIRSEVSGEWIDGEYVTLSTTPQLTTKFFSSLVSVQKPITNGPIRLYEYNTDTTTQRAIAYYEPDETRPSYRRSFISGLQVPCCGSSDCETTTVNVMAKLAFIPARVDTDWLIIGNLNALQYMCQSLFKLEANVFDEAQAWEAKAIQEMDRELRHMVGSGIVQPLKMTPRNIGGSAVVNLV